MEGIKIVMKEDVKKTTLSISAIELEIIAAISDGKTSKEVADERGIASKTVEVHRHNVLKRLGCKNMPQLIKTLFRHNLLS